MDLKYFDTCLCVPENHFNMAASGFVLWGVCFFNSTMFWFFPPNKVLPSKFMGYPT